MGPVQDYAHGYRMPRPGRDRNAESLADGLGWFSVALGAAELLAPHALGRALGMEDRANLLRAYGVREIVTGIGILAQDDPSPWLWARVGGDVLDLATLATGLHPDNPERGRVGLAIGAVAAVTALDVACANALGSRRHPAHETSGYPGYEAEAWGEEPWDVGGEGEEDPAARPYDRANA